MAVTKEQHDILTKLGVNYEKDMNLPRPPYTQKNLDDFLPLALSVIEFVKTHKQPGGLGVDFTEIIGALPKYKNGISNDEFQELSYIFGQINLYSDYGFFKALDVLQNHIEYAAYKKHKSHIISLCQKYNFSFHETAGVFAYYCAGEFLDKLLEEIETDPLHLSGLGNIYSGYYDFTSKAKELHCEFLLEYVNDMVEGNQDIKIALMRAIEHAHLKT